ncbi:hypothetical protein HPB47_027046, partial [Ixodes persulcatus]
MTEMLQRLPSNISTPFDPLFYPNIRRILQILVTLFVTTANAERSFCTLRCLKTYLRATASQVML